jgi:hypothetical protein
MQAYSQDSILGAHARSKWKETNKQIHLQPSHPNPFHIESHLSAAADVLFEIQLQTLLAPAQPQICITLRKRLLLQVEHSC